MLETHSTKGNDRDFFVSITKATVNHYNRAHKELNKVDKDVLQITDKPIGIEPISVEKPNRTD